jgi:hypothetical protein
MRIINVLTLAYSIDVRRRGLSTGIRRGHQALFIARNILNSTLYFNFTHLHIIVHRHIYILPTRIELVELTLNATSSSAVIETSATSMCSKMLVQIIRPREPLLTPWTRIRPLHRMRAKMSFQMFHSLEHPSTREQWAGEGFRLRPRTICWYFRHLCPIIGSGGGQGQSRRPLNLVRVGYIPRWCSHRICMPMLVLWVSWSR